MIWLCIFKYTYIPAQIKTELWACARWTSPPGSHVASASWSSWARRDLRRFHHGFHHWEPGHDGGELNGRYPLVISHSYWKWPSKSMIYPWNMVIFNSYVNVYQRVFWGSSTSLMGILIGITIYVEKKTPDLLSRSFVIGPGYRDQFW